ncbi:MAG: arsenate reductase (glutaredoxin) [Hellea sp.]|nr:arsenate reductase (glutaredoxin) [Hellea sp.]MDG2361977.1 arsenate reductase (glutaredoxin) [Hellea sp.]
MTLIIYHNTRCSKSREILTVLDENGINYDVYKYMENIITFEVISDLLEKLGYQSAQELMRKKEAIYKTLNLKQESNEELLIKAMIENPKLIERPIAIKGDKAVVCRPAKNVFSIL